MVAAIGGTNGILIGNVNSSSGGKVDVRAGDLSANADGCVAGLGCMSEIVGKKNCIMVGNIGMPANCGNQSLIGEAVKELEHLGYEVEDDLVSAGKAIANTAKDVGRAVKHFFSGW